MELKFHFGFWIRQFYCVRFLKCCLPMQGPHQVTALARSQLEGCFNQAEAQMTEGKNLN